MQEAEHGRPPPLRKRSRQLTKSAEKGGEASVQTHAAPSRRIGEFWRRTAPDPAPAPLLPTDAVVKREASTDDSQSASKPRLDAPALSGDASRRRRRLLVRSAFAAALLLLAAAAGLIIFATNGGFSEASRDPDFRAWKERFNVTYATWEENERRFGLFSATAELVSTLNAAENVTASFDVRGSHWPGLSHLPHLPPPDPTNRCAHRLLVSRARSHAARATLSRTQLNEFAALDDAEQAARLGQNPASELIKAADLDSDALSWNGWRIISPESSTPGSGNAGRSASQQKSAHAGAGRRRRLQQATTPDALDWSPAYTTPITDQGASASSFL